MQIMNRALETLIFFRWLVCDFSISKLLALAEASIWPTLPIDLQPAASTTWVFVNDDSTHFDGKWDGG